MKENLVKEFYHLGGICRRYRFANNYGASVINHQYSYGLELAVLDFKEDEEGRITYDTPITDNVIGHIESDKELNKILNRIKRLKR